MWLRRSWQEVANYPDWIWRPIDQTPPPKPETQKRIRRWIYDTEYLQVLPGDPPDLDAFLAAFDKWVETPDKMSTYIDKVDAKSAMLKARQGEGGKE